MFALVPIARRCASVYEREGFCRSLGLHIERANHLNSARNPSLVPSTLAAAMRALAQHHTRGFTFVRADATEHFLSFAEIVSQAERRASGMLAHGLQKGDRVALVIPESDEFVLSFLGAVLGGLVPVPMYPQLSFKNVQSYHETARHVLGASQAKLMVTTAGTREFIAPACEHAKVVLGPELATAALVPMPDVAPEDLCFLQFTSGSTSKPKGVAVTHRNLAWNAESFMIHGLDKNSETDKGVSWLPLFHDMGLIGFVIGPLFADIEVVFIPTASFVRTPRMWLDKISKHRGTITYAPNFAYALVTKRLKDKDLAELDLSCLRHAGSGAEPIQPATLREFAAKLAPAGFKAEAFLPSYGMAEGTLAITFSDMRRLGEIRGLRTDRVIQRELEQGRALPGEGEGTQEIVNCGRAFPEHEIAIVDPETRARLLDRQVGEVIARGPSVCAGYYQDAEKTAEGFRDGWLHTGDLGYTVNGDVFICGRLKDMIIIRGRNFYPNDMEWAVSELERVRRGNVVAFSIPVQGEEALVICAEAFQSDAEGLRDQIAQLINEQFSLTPHSVEIVPQGSLPRTSSGKPQRRKTRELYLANGFAKPKAAVNED
jgi:fatty-acyl-CoA synthase